MTRGGNRGRRRLATSESRPGSNPVTSTKPDKLAWSTARKLAKGDVSRLIIISPTEILVTRPKD